ncbi:MAG: cyclic nucleotide-binding domain-containing protein [Oscillospiraceae bacterium]|nr:cyclic nucleotide-binding domain-containing protein [Oscillospiraceae bacterium]
MNTLVFKKGDVIFRQGDYSEVMYDIAKGKVGIFADYETETVQQLAELKAGDFLGEMGMIEVYPRSATAVALEDDTALTEIGEDDLNEFFKDKPEKLLQIMKQMSERLRVVNQKYLNACRVAFENANAEAANAEKSEELKKEMDALYEEYENL